MGKDRMDLHKSGSAIEKLRFSDLAAEKWSRSAAGELPPALSEALSDPIVQALMAADGVERESVERLMRRVINRLSAASV